MHGPTCIFWANLTPFSRKSGAPLLSEMLYPVPPPDLSFVVRTFGEACADGAAASTCLKPMTATAAFGVATDACPGGKGGCRNWKIYGVSSRGR